VAIAVQHRIDISATKCVARMYERVGTDLQDG